MTVANKTTGRGDSRRLSIISDRRQRISESFSGQNGNSEELKKSFDEWMKIVADNVDNIILNIIRKLMQVIVGLWL